jgi:uncharacterized protein YxjI
MFGRRRQKPEVGADVYQVRERLMDIGDDYWIETGDGRRAFKVDGKVLRVRDTFVLRGADGTELARLQERMVRVRDSYGITRPGRPDATVKKALISPFRDRWTVEADDIGEWRVQGNVVDHEYTFEDEEGHRIAETSKRWFRVRDTYGVQVDPAADAALVLAVTVAIDQMAHD